MISICSFRNINVNYLHNLIEVQADKREAIFAKINSEAGETVTVKVSNILYILQACWCVERHKD